MNIKLDDSLGDRSHFHFGRGCDRTIANRPARHAQNNDRADSIDDRSDAKGGTNSNPVRYARDY